METELTKRIKALTHHYRPNLNTDKRTIRLADEVQTPTGYVDSIRFEDYVEKDYTYCRKIEQRPGDEKNITLKCDEKCKIEGETFPCDACKNCVYKRNVFELGILITCFEVKITYADFKSKNGHNFFGNENYYCVPKELAPKIAKEVPDDIGILAYYEGENYRGLREYKPCKMRTVDMKLKVLFLYNAMKKWCDKTVFVDN